MVAVVSKRLSNRFKIIDPDFRDMTLDSALTKLATLYMKQPFGHKTSEKLFYSNVGG